MHIPSEKVYNKMRTEIASLWYVPNKKRRKYLFYRPFTKAPRERCLFFLFCFPSSIADAERMIFSKDLIFSKNCGTIIMLHKLNS